MLETGGDLGWRNIFVSGFKQWKNLIFVIVLMQRQNVLLCLSCWDSSCSSDGTGRLFNQGGRGSVLFTLGNGQGPAPGQRCAAAPGSTGMRCAHPRVVSPARMQIQAVALREAAPLGGMAGFHNRYARNLLF